MFIQEAMTGARLLRLNEDFSYEEDELIANKVLVFGVVHMQKERHQNASDIQICPMAIAACAQLQASAGNTSCLIMALCAATMAQLHLDPLVDGSRTVDSLLH
jgi:hypothetical protein